MGAEPNELQGPDLRRGVPLSEVAEGEPFLGHADGAPVLLVRRGREVFAIGASCTHYGGPLAEGLVVGETVRCPWHHACFSVRTGEALGAPALNPVARWEVAVRDGTVFVEGKEETGPLAARGRRADGPESVLIVGAGAAGSAAAEMLRREGYDGPVRVIDPETDAPYDRPNLSKDYLAGNAPEEWIPLRPTGFYEEHGIERVPVAAAALDARARTVTLSDGRVMPFGALLLATGATPIRLRIPGAELPHVHLLRSLADSRRIIRGSQDARRAVVLGASFIGMEVAASLRARQLEVTVVAPESVPFERTLGAELGDLLRTAHEENGVRFHLGHTAAEIGPERVRLDDGTELEAELVVMGVGVRPATDLAEAAGLAVDRGVLVDEFLETGAPGVFAAGDAARWPDARTGERIRVEHWVVAQRQGQAAARNILGRRQRFADVPFFWTRQFGVGIRYVGHAERWDEIRTEGDPAKLDAVLRYVRDGQILAVATIGRDRDALTEEARMEAAVAPGGGPSVEPRD